MVPVPPDPEAMAELAETTGGRSFDAASADQLRDVYSEIQSDVGYTIQTSDLWPWFVAVGLLLLMAATLAAMVWSGRFL